MYEVCPLLIEVDNILVFYSIYISSFCISISDAILGTYQEKGANTFWHIVRRLQLSTDAITCWKFLHVLHKLLRDGHESVSRNLVHTFSYQGIY